MGPPLVSEGIAVNGVSNPQGVTLYTAGGDVGCGNIERSSKIQVACLHDYPGTYEGAADFVTEGLQLKHERFAREGYDDPHLKGNYLTTF
tara:strand:+ start:387 stop:656 length:270 start_codon:yes stop_codon:yes gene_type:complete